MWFFPAVLSQNPIVFRSGTFWARCCFCVCRCSQQLSFSVSLFFLKNLTPWQMASYLFRLCAYFSEDSESLRQVTSIDQCSRTPKGKENYKPPFLRSCSCTEQFQLQGDCLGSLETVELRDQSIWWLRHRKQVCENRNSVSGSAFLL